MFQISKEIELTTDLLYKMMNKFTDENLPKLHTSRQFKNPQFHIFLQRSSEACRNILFILIYSLPSSSSARLAAQLPDCAT